MFAAPNVEPTSQSLISEIAKLLALFDAYRDRDASAADIMAALAELPGGLVQYLIEFQRRPDEPFIARRRLGPAQYEDRSWLRWPLDRIIALGIPARIAHPWTGDRALAIPLRERATESVVLAILTERALTSDEEAFFAACERIRLPAQPVEEAGPFEPLDPAILSVRSFCSNFAERAKGLLNERGWGVEILGSFHDLALRLARRPPDAVLIDGNSADLKARLRFIRQNQSALHLPIVAFCEDGCIDAELKILADAVLTPNASDHVLFTTIKSVLRAASVYRRRQLQLERRALRELLDRCNSAQEIVELAAETIAATIDGWAAIHLLDARGRVFSAERGAGMVPVFTHVPETLLHERPIFAAHADTAFVNELTLHEDVAAEFLALEPVSAASVPIIRESLHLGSLVCATRRHRADAAEFDLLLNLADDIGIVFSGKAHSKEAVRPEFSRVGGWSDVHIRPFRILFCSPHSPALRWRFFRISDESLVVRLAYDDVRSPDSDQDLALRLHTTHDVAAVVREVLPSNRETAIAGVLNLRERVFTYALRGAPSPRLIGARGPSGIEKRDPSDLRNGTLYLRPDSWIRLDENAAAATEIPSPEASTRIADVFASNPHNGTMFLTASLAGVPEDY